MNKSLFLNMVLKLKNLTNIHFTRVPNLRTNLKASLTAFYHFFFLNKDSLLHCFFLS